MELVLSEKQEKIKETWINTDNNILINAVAGSSKTTMLMLLLKECKYKTLFLAFNKSIQIEITERIEKQGLAQGKALTLHSLGLSAIRLKYPRVIVNKTKSWDIIRQVQDSKEFKKVFKFMPWEDKLSLSYNLKDINDVSRLFLTNDLQEIEENLISMDKYLFKHDSLQRMWELFVKFRDESYEKDNIEVDFTDMVYLPVIKNLYIPVDPTYLFIDEAQDLCYVQHIFVDMLINQGDIEKWIAVGDYNQSIYGFSGAYSNSFARFKSKDNVVELPLDICYRCAKGIINSANQVYDVMLPFKEGDGIVKTHTELPDIPKNAMVICRNSAPLISLFFQLISQGKPCVLKGDDILNSILNFIKPYKKQTVFYAQREMLYKQEELSEDKTEQGKIAYAVFQNNFTNFQTCISHLCTSSETIVELEKKIEVLFKEKEDSIILCTIHKSKGLEANVVFILNESLIPSKFAKSSEQIKQERNLKYVARTRAKEELHFLNLE